MNWGRSLRVACALGAVLCSTLVHAAPTPAEAARFLTQATFGPTQAQIDAVGRDGYDAWLQQQFAAPPTLHRPQLQLPNFTGTPNQTDRQEVWWRHSITAPDQLRQRIAFALSEILPVSDVVTQLSAQPLLLAEYYDTLLRDAFGNYRTLLQDVTLAPAMGVYLSMINNDKGDPASGRRPDENYAREVMQLFSIGLWRLNADGSAQRDGAGARMPTFDQRTVTNFARVFTGWGWGDGKSFYTYGSSYQPMKAYEEHHDTGDKTLLDGAHLPAGASSAQDLQRALDNIFQHPNVGPFIARRLIQRLTTSNPSPAYLQRVAQAFNDNGAGTRGDLQAVVRAVLLDPEARATPAAGFGKLREPLLRLSALWRAFAAAAGDGKYAYPNAEHDWGQAALRAPTVFNFFEPDFRLPGASGEGAPFAPEFQIQTESHSMSVINAYTRFVRRQSACATPASAPTANRGQINLDLCAAAAAATDPSALIGKLDLLLTAGQMPAAMKTALADYLSTLPPGDGVERARQAIFLVASSPEFAVQK